MKFPVALSANLMVCPVCHSHMRESDGGWRCRSCDRVFKAGDAGYIEFTLEPEIFDKESTTDELAELQANDGAVRLDEEYVLPFVRREPARRILDVGCGIGRTVSRLLAEGLDAYGVDLPCLTRFWQKQGLSPERFFVCDAVRLPFPDDCFDAVISLGVIEHIGTLGGDCTLADDYPRARQKYADELLRVTRPGGRILVACPNKRFPVDLQHTVTDSFTADTLMVRLRDAAYQKTHLNIHRVWGKYHLLSYSEVRQLFCGPGRMHEFTPLPVRGYFALHRFESGFLKPFGRLADLWINHMPACLRTSWVNPYVIVQVRKR